MKKPIIIIILLISFQQVFSQKASKLAEVKIKTSAVCNMCKEKIEKELTFTKGVKAVNLDLSTKIVTITYRTGKTNVEKLKTVITKIGYDADEQPADAKAYENLSPCCKKDAPPHH